MKLIYMTIFLSFLTLSILSCTKTNLDGSEDTSTDELQTINGSVQKGPFIIGTNISLYLLDSNLNQTGESYTTTTTDNLGSFEIKPKAKKGAYVEIIANGYYFDEISGQLSDGQLTLRTIGQLSNRNKLNINILTSLQFERVKDLMANGQSFGNASAQAQSEILSAFGITEKPLNSFQEMDITSEGNDNAKLLAISTTLLQVAHTNSSTSNNIVAELSSTVANIISDIKSDGKIDSTTYSNRISAAKQALDTGAIRQHLLERYAEIGISLSVPDLDFYASNPWSTLFSFSESLGSMACLNDNCYLVGSPSKFLKFNLPTSTLTQMPNLPFSQNYRYRKMVVIGDKIYLNKISDPYVNELWAYDTLNNTWTKKASPQPNIQYTPLIYQNKIYFFGTTNSSYCEVYNPDTNSWTRIASMNSIITAATSVLVGNKAYIFGRDPSPLLQVATYDFANNTFTQEAISNPGFGDVGSIFVLSSINNDILIAFRSNAYSSNIWKFNTDSKIWNRLSETPPFFDYVSNTYIYNNDFIIHSLYKLYKYSPSKE